MINLRYHIVSITAVFLALGIGTALGGTFLDKYTVDVLDRNIRSAEERIKETNAENARLEREIAQARARDESLIRVAGSSLLRDHLTDVPVLIVTAPGVGTEVLSNLRLAVDQSGADLRGTLELREALTFTDDVSDDLAELVDMETDDEDAGPAVLAELQTVLREAGAPALEADPDGEAQGDDAEPGTDGQAPTTTAVPEGEADTVPEPGTDEGTTTTTAPEEILPPVGPDGGQPDVVSALLAGDYMRFTPGPGLSTDDPILETTGYRYIYVSGPDVDVLGNDLLLKLLPPGPPDEVLPAIVVSESVPSTANDADRAPTAVARVRDSNEMSAAYSTVDDLDSFTGLVATVLVLESLDWAEVGHYGQAQGATAILPPSS